MIKICILVKVIHIFHHYKNLNNILKAKITFVFIMNKCKLLMDMYIHIKKIMFLLKHLHIMN
jgi:hypothetical protein